jgi:hypothetical protein
MVSSRRSFLFGSASALCIARVGIPASAHARTDGDGDTSFNGGKSQFNVNSVQDGGDFAFINLIKMSQGWSYNAPPIDPAAPRSPIIELDSDGYVTSIVVGTSGVNSVFQMPTKTEYSGNWVLKWDGTGAVAPTGFSFTKHSSAPGRIVFSRNDNLGSPSVVVSSTNASPNHVRDIVLCRADQEAVLASGQIFNPDHINLVRSARPGRCRSLGWGGAFAGTGESFIALWSQRKPRTYFTYANFYDNPAFYGGRTTNSGSDYTLSYPGFALTNKVLLNVLFNANTPQPNLQNVSFSNTSGNPIVITWPSTHNLQIGNTVCFGNSSSPPPSLKSAQTYFIHSVPSGTTFTISATSGGTAINAISNVSGTCLGLSIPRININSTGFIPITNVALPVPSNIFLGYFPPQTGGLFTLVYDSTIGYFLSAQNRFVTGAPPEIFVDYCAAIGAHPHLVSPFLTQTPVTDYMPKWSEYATDSYPWMKPFIEPPNETWASGGLGTTYSGSLSWVLWRSQNDLDNVYGMWCSDVGQAISAIYGNDRTKYSMLCAVQTVGFVNGVPRGTPGPNDRLVCTRYVAHGGDPAYKWVDRVCGANYYTPPTTFTVNELIDAYAYNVTYAGNPTQHASIVDTYIASAIEPTPPYHQFSLNYVNRCFINLKAWALGMPTGNTIKGITCYEGGFSADYLNASASSPMTGNWLTNISRATQANPCVLTLNSISYNNQYPFAPGNPAVIGMAITISGSPMTQLNNPPVRSVTFKRGAASISGPNTLKVNQAVTLTGGSLPSPFVATQPYFVINTGLSGSAFQLSATKGGSAIIAGANGNSNAQEGWFVTAVASNTGTGDVAIDVDSTSFTAIPSSAVTFTIAASSVNWTAHGKNVGELVSFNTTGTLPSPLTQGTQYTIWNVIDANRFNIQDFNGTHLIFSGTQNGTQTGFAAGGVVDYTNSLTYSNKLRQAVVNSAGVGPVNTQMYANFDALSQSGFVAEWPSNFLYTGTQNIWSILNPNIYATKTAQWNSVVAYNN